MSGAAWTWRPGGGRRSRASAPIGAPQPWRASHLHRDARRIGRLVRAADNAVLQHGMADASDGALPRVPRPAVRGHRRHAQQRGYTLIEVIVAFGVLALALTLLLGTLSGATRQVRDADLSGRAALHAQSLLDQVGVGEVLEPGVREGEFERGRYRWTLNVAPYRDAARAAQPQAVAEPELMQLLLNVQWGDDPRRERLQLRTLRLVAPEVGAGVVP